ncbi:rhodanese-like domain-containing protein [Polynucleobacter sp. IMCC 30228]|nr:rhodanese-like domain-containing protein [Polynucleobacter sp. IMCC 30228]MCE7526469.1 rhodanese-like domain-containing protein [Polynucleobacter sp. IMCC 30228]MCE7529755.1 rhodanese-like domain-containing protein [Polynucleobacter sp. IMCC 29146]
MQTDNLALIGVMAAAGLALLMPTISTLISGVGLSVAEATTWINRRKAVVLDLRAPADFQAGHLPNSKSLPFSKLSSDLERLKLDRKLPLILVCQNGNESRRAAQQLRKMGFAEVGLLDGGLKAWQTANLPLVK